MVVVPDKVSVDTKSSQKYIYKSTKTYTHSLGLSCAFRQWKAESHCRFLHGYAIQVRIEFETQELDHRGWVVDFGSLKSFKQILEDTLDHTVMIAEDDPNLDYFVEGAQLGLLQLRIVDHCGMENLALMITEVLDGWLFDNGYGNRVSVSKVEVSEHGANSAIVEKVS